MQPIKIMMNIYQSNTYNRTDLILLMLSSGCLMLETENVVKHIFVIASRMCLFRHSAAVNTAVYRTSIKATYYYVKRN